MNRENIEKMIDFFEELPEGRFNYEHYFSNEEGKKYYNAFENPSLVKNDCGTAACLAGWVQIVLGKNVHILGDVQYHLGIDFDTTLLLCMENLEQADKIHISHMLARLEHLLKHETLEDYDFDAEIGEENE